MILIGNLGKDPEVRHLESGRAVANFSLATSETYKNREGEKVTHTEWHNIVLWTPLAEIGERFLKKGSQVYIEGKLTTRSYDDKDGTKRYINEVVGREMTLLGGRPADSSGGGAIPNSGSVSEPARSNEPAVATTPTSTATLGGDSAEVDDLPF